jgi:Sec-independent protein translocase protein TatA
MKEAGDLMGKMKDMGGQDQFNEMFKNMAKSMGGMGKNMKLDTNALDRMTKQASTRDRIRAKMQDRKQKQIDELEKQNEQYKKQLELQQSMMAKYSLESTDTNKFVFRLDGEEAQEKSFITNDFIADLQSGVATNAVQGDKKKKKKKTKK